MKNVAAILLIAFGLFLLYSYNTGRLMNIYHVLIDPSSTVKSPYTVFNETGNSSAHQCSNLLDLNCILASFDNISIPSTPPVTQGEPYTCSVILSTGECI